MPTLIAVIFLIAIIIFCFEMVKLAIRKENSRENAIEEEKQNLKLELIKKDTNLKELDVLINDLKDGKF
jgi:hypothetical protein